MLLILVLCLIGFVAGRLASVWAASQIEDAVVIGVRRCEMCRTPVSRVRQLISCFSRMRCPNCGAADRAWPIWVSLTTAIAFASFGWLLIEFGSQSVSEVRPSLELWKNRLPFHLLFIFLLTTATVTDFLDYVIPDMVVLPGALLAVLLATFSGELQMIHVWVDWDYDFVALYGPYLPQWMKDHQHVHGLVWSSCGLLLGAGLMWAARIVASWILGVPAIGFGDVTLMAMIGAFMGWQPVLCVLAIAPFVGIIIGFGGRLITGRSFVAFGPYLCIAAFAVLCTWRMLWEGLRLKIIFSHWPTVVAMVAGSFIAFCILLAALRMFRATPVERLR